MTDTMPRPTMVAGQFYPASPRTLAQAVRTFLDTATVEPAPERVRALVVPHAGYVYSGQTAGFAFRRIGGKRPSRAVLPVSYTPLPLPPCYSVSLPAAAWSLKTTN